MKCYILNKAKNGYYNIGFLYYLLHNIFKKLFLNQIRQKSSDVQL